MPNKNKDMTIFREALKSMIEVVKNKSKPENIYYLSPEIDLTKRAWRLGVKTKIWYPNVPVAFYDEIMKLESVKRCLDLMLERDFPKYLEMLGRITDKNGKPVENPDYRPFLMAAILGQFVNRYLESHGFEFIEENFEKLYNEMVTYVYSKHREIIVVSPLENFELNGIDGFSIGGYRVRKLTEWEMKDFIEHGYKLGFMFTPEGGTIETMYCIEKIVKTPSKIGFPRFEPYIQDFITALRLFKCGGVSHGPILHYPKIWGTAWSMSFSFKQPMPASSYMLSKDELRLIASFLEQFIQLKDRLPNNVVFALRWFNKSYEESYTLDRLLSLAIALEVLFGTSNRLDLHVPHFLGLNKEDRLKVNETITDLRKIRNKIVHHGHSNEVESQFVDAVEGIFRRTAQKFLGLLPNLTYEEILRDIKTSILQ